MTTIPLPPLCLTLLPPWTQAILRAGKRIENRSASVAAQIGGYCGLVGLSQSKTYDWVDCEASVLALRDDKHISLPPGFLPYGFTKDPQHSVNAMKGKLFIVANLVAIRRPFEAHLNPWHVPGQYGLLFDKVWEVEPVACVGGVGAWRAQWCTACKKVVADTQGLACKTCLSKLVLGPECPPLRIIREVLP